MELVEMIGRGRTMSKFFAGLFSLTLLAALTNTALAADASNGESLARHLKNPLIFK